MLTRRIFASCISRTKILSKCAQSKKLINTQRSHLGLAQESSDATFDGIQVIYVGGAALTACSLLLGNTINGYIMTDIEKSKWPPRDAVGYFAYGIDKMHGLFFGTIKAMFYAPLWPLTFTYCVYGHYNSMVINHPDGKLYANHFARHFLPNSSHRITWWKYTGKYENNEDRLYEKYGMIVPTQIKS